MADQATNSRLGRGLASLMGDIGVETAPDVRARAQRQIPTAFLKPNPHNPRKAFDADDLDDLTASIREKGVVQPLLVRPAAAEGEAYEIIAGERRWRAAQRAGLHQVPVVVREVTDREALELAIIENVQRSDLNPLEEALGYQQLIEEHDYSQGELAEVIGKSRPHISNTLRLLKLPAEVQDYLKAGKLTAGHARALVTHDDPLAAARHIVETGLSVRDAEAIPAKGKPPKSPRAAKVKDADTRALEKNVADHLGLAVTIDHGEKGGSVKIRYKTLEQLDDIVRRLRFL